MRVAIFLGLFLPALQPRDVVLAIFKSFKVRQMLGSTPVTVCLPMFKIASLEYVKHMIALLLSALKELDQ
jgi:hypothetical protein